MGLNAVQSYPAERVLVALCWDVPPLSTNWADG